MRVYPVVPMSVRDVMNTCVIENYEIPEGSRVFIAQSASHYMSDVFPEPFSFSISTAFCRRAKSMSVPGTPRSGWARTHASASGGQNCSWLSIY